MLNVPSTATMIGYDYSILLMKLGIFLAKFPKPIFTT